MHPYLRRASIGAAFATLLSVAPSPADETRVETKPYTGSSDARTGACELGQAPGELHGVAGVCFELNGNERVADLRIDDDRSARVPATYKQINGLGTVTATSTICGELRGLTILPGTTRLAVAPAGPVLGPLMCGASIGPATTGSVTATFALGDHTPPAFDETRECLEPVPVAVGVAGVTDPGDTIDLAVRVLRDGVSLAAAQEHFERAAVSYEPVGITLRAFGYDEVAFTGVDAQGLLNQSKQLLGGRRPTDADIVYTITSKNITASGAGDAVAGLADCIGGVRFPEHAFAVGEVIASIPAGPITFYPEATARTIAHEIGHLMGAHHHYANCHEDIPGDAEAGELTPCTLMFASLDTLGDDFGLLERAVVRGHAHEYASP